MSNAILDAEEEVLSTLNKDGSRHWIKPRIAKGSYHRKRQIFAYLLISIFTLLPLLRIGNKQALFLDVAQREFTFFGFTFYPTDTILFAIFLVAVLISIFLLTSLFGRVWCGWACPQTVYLEFVFRPIERFFDGTAGRGGTPRKQIPDYRTYLKYLTYFLICFYLSNTFLAYFVGTSTLWQWMQQSPIRHPLPFLFVLTVSFFMMYNFCFFREQLCILACPYGRFQSVLLDDQSMIVSYDKERGEPRTRLQRTQSDSHSCSADGLPVPNRGDCVDCKLCIAVCPTGIDIRDGLQMECVNCTQCIDACDGVMEKLNRKPRLIRYSSKAVDERRQKKLLRARSITYPIVLLLLATLFGVILAFKQGFTATLLRGQGNQYSIETNELIRNQLKIRIVNRQNVSRSYNVSISTPLVTLAEEFVPIEIAAGKMSVVPFSIEAPFSEFQSGKLPVEIKVSDDAENVRRLPFNMLGPHQLPNTSLSNGENRK